MKLFHGTYIGSFFKYRKIANMKKYIRNAEVYYDKYSAHRWG